ncbi:NAD(P)-dependent dehydrogenase (short-subunit alcohol dehydrogenase family) [Silvibacterium bohemicum]|uniref:NAD(P)-dependent dehydrogenase (Short-subunit alcohol dehydrogenase family) n=1 Tax=Silvibacterium bohemicum TaxID=1577686 RepID=A0A841JYH3_9BACT|nr:SDR family oxidoreductase [Silvibacterium bohemicum]MBB6144021.1 NAD(P)-dependent dehydrogenase (short-subunit alcohol dehydrogenase family) [Silvibacterium bohemicum]
MDLGLKGKRALVTGSTAGIGFAIARQLAAEGAFVYVNGRTEERVNRAVGEIEGKVDGVAADLATEEGAKKLFARVPKLDILVNNMGIFEAKPFLEIEDAEWRRFFDTNVLSGVRVTRHYLPQMLAQKWGRVLFISSESALQIPAEMVHYGMTKTAQLAVARGIAESFPASGVTVNSVLAGPTDSEGVATFVEGLARQQGKTKEELTKEFFEHARPSSLLKRWETIDEIASMVVYLCSQQASATTGASVRVEGGVVKSIA